MSVSNTSSSNTVPFLFWEIDADIADAVTKTATAVGVGILVGTGVGAMAGAAIGAGLSTSIGAAATTGGCYGAAAGGIAGVGYRVYQYNEEQNQHNEEQNQPGSAPSSKKATTETNITQVLDTFVTKLEKVYGISKTNDTHHGTTSEGQKEGENPNPEGVESMDKKMENLASNIKEHQDNTQSKIDHYREQLEKANQKQKRTNRKCREFFEATKIVTGICNEQIVENLKLRKKIEEFSLEEEANRIMMTRLYAKAQDKLNDTEKQLQRTTTDLTNTQGKHERATRKVKELVLAFNQLSKVSEERVVNEKAKHITLTKMYVKKCEELEITKINLEVVTAEKNTALAEKETVLAEKETAITEKNRALGEKETAIAEKNAAVADKELAKVHLRQIQNSNPITSLASGFANAASDLFK